MIERVRAIWNQFLGSCLAIFTLVVTHAISGYIAFIALSAFIITYIIIYAMICLAHHYKIQKKPQLTKEK